MNNEENHLLDILNLIYNLQKNVTHQDNNNQCLRPTLGLNQTVLSNTRPVMFFQCNSEPLSVNYTLNGAANTSTIFRIENIDNNCVVVRLLAETADTITATNEYATINMNCIAALKCLPDVNLTL